MFQLTRLDRLPAEVRHEILLQSTDHMTLKPCSFITVVKKFAAISPVLARDVAYLVEKKKEAHAALLKEMKKERDERRKRLKEIAKIRRNTFYPRGSPYPPTRIPTRRLPSSLVVVEKGLQQLEAASKWVAKKTVICHFSDEGISTDFSQIFPRRRSKRIAKQLKRDL